MPKQERVREILDGPLTPEYAADRAKDGWRLAAIEWVREVPGEAVKNSLEAPPFGLRVAGDCAHLEKEPNENEMMMHMIEMIAKDSSLPDVAEDLNRQGYRMRTGAKWNPVAVFHMLPRLIDAGPRIFSSEEWNVRRARLMRD